MYLKRDRETQRNAKIMEYWWKNAINKGKKAGLLNISVWVFKFEI